MIRVVEGKFVGTENDFNKAINTLSQDFKGYLRISVKKNGNFEEGYIFIKNGKIIGYYYTYDKELFGHDAKESIEKLMNSGYLVEIFEYDDEKLNLMQELEPEIFISDPKNIFKEKEEKRDEILNKPISEHKEDVEFLHIALNIPDGKLIKMNVNKDFKNYLKKGYTLVDVFRKVDSEYERGYIIFKDNEPIVGIYECSKGVLLGIDACPYLKKLLDDENAIIDVYEYSPTKVDIILEAYPKALLLKDENEKKKEKYEESKYEKVTKNEEKIDFGNVGETPISSKQNEDRKENINTELENLSREELLKRLNIKPPDENWVENMVRELTFPSESELEELRYKIKERIYNSIKELDGVRDVDVNIRLNCDYDGKIVCEGEVVVKTKKLLGIIKKDINAKEIENKINNTLKAYHYEFDSKIVIKIE
ncbi:DUF2226 domain-containing protein [Methanotorris igneus]|uniref:DUF2226 domain-containing protein n=1 Tax=Methanotorris igneus (strain DSM 5666 / JCM 11834 / Kol 5) TaxID=880724 RepID=F6BB86_METIK|nr:DUF2226 domain-containing protein [Methanotorris igneus]AEF95971.1 Protein of unknown function DUF2226 [Methanotorris igneus Kol 5]